MSLILAIEPDRRQAAQLMGVIRHRVGAQLVLADTTERALDAIGDQVPDLVLVPALLSPQDDAALAAALRVIAAAAHVRTLTTPVLASTTKHTDRGGVLAKWRRGRTKSPAQDDAGCDPAVFAEQMTAYLKEAAAERAELQAARALAADEEAPIQEVAQPTAAEAVAKPVEVEPAFETPASDDTPVVVATVLTGQPSLVMPVHEEVAPVDKAVVDAPAKPEDVIDLSRQLLDLADEAALKKLLDEEPGEIQVIASAPEEPAIEVFDLLPALLEEPEACEPVVATANESVVELVDLSVAAVAVEPDVAPERPEIELWMPLSLGANRSWPRLEGLRAEAAPLVLEPEEIPTAAQHERDLVAGQPEPAAIIAAQLASAVASDVVSLDLKDEVSQAAGPADGLSERGEWVELVASLRLDIERLRTERLQPPPVVVSAKADEVRKPSLAPVVTTAPPRPARAAKQGKPAVRKRKRKRQTKKRKPIQDEWGFFDPEQCGFAALLAKLDEITGAGDDAEVRPPV